MAAEDGECMMMQVVVSVSGDGMGRVICWGRYNGTFVVSVHCLVREGGRGI